MKTRKLAFIALLLILVGTSTGWAKSYDVEELTVEAAIQPDGSLDVIETISYRFKGSYRYAYREIPTGRAGRIENIRVGEGNDSYWLGPESSEASNSSRNYYIVEESDDEVRITWYFKARNERRSFRVAYTIRDVVRRHPDTAEFYYKFVGSGWKKSIDRVGVVVRMIEGVPPETIRAWAHGPLHGTVALPGDGTVRFDVSPLPSRTFWEGRILFPATAVAGIPVVSREPAREQIMAEEASWAEEANRRREEAIQAAKKAAELVPVLAPVAILAALIGIGVWVFLFLRHGKPYKKERTFVPGEPPSSHPPALVAYLMHRMIGGGAIILTLLDLARRGYLKIREEEREKKGLFWNTRKTDYRFDRTEETTEGLQDFERELLDFMFEQAGDGTGFWISDFKKIASKNKSQFLKWFKAWKKRLEERGKQEEFFEPYQLKPILLNIFCGVAILVAGSVICFLTNSPAGLPAIVVGAVQAIFSGFLTRRTVQGQQLHAQWTGFKKHIKSISKAMSPISLTSEEWGRYIVAAVLFGLDKKLGKVLELSVGKDTSGMLPWYVYDHSNHTRGIGGMGGGVSSMVSSVASTMSSASGMGGGASGGGGGGAGGGGGGAG